MTNKQPMRFEKQTTNQKSIATLKACPIKKKNHWSGELNLVVIGLLVIGSGYWERFLAEFTFIRKCAVKVKSSGTPG